MGIASFGLSAIGKLLAVGLLLAAFLFGMAGVVYMSLQGSEVQVPDITGKDFRESETELASLGLKIKKRADRASTEKPNTVIEQLPKPGETVKTGQMILVVISKQQIEGEEAPRSLEKDDGDDTDKIEEMLTDKPKKPKANANRKKADTSRDTNTDTNSGPASNSNSSESNSNKKDPSASDPGDKPKANPTPKPAAPKPGVDGRLKPKP